MSASKALRVVSWGCLGVGFGAMLLSLLDGQTIGAAYGAAGLVSWTSLLTVADFVDAALARLDSIEKQTKRAADALDIISRG